MHELFTSQSIFGETRQFWGKCKADQSGSLAALRTLRLAAFMTGREGRKRGPEDKEISRYTSQQPPSEQRRRQPRVLRGVKQKVFQGEENARAESMDTRMPVVGECLTRKAQHSNHNL